MNDRVVYRGSFRSFRPADDTMTHPALPRASARARSRLRHTLAVALLVVSWSCGGGEAAAPVTPPPTSPTIQVVLSTSATSLAAGETRQLNAVVSGTANSGVVWSSSTESVATVTPAGLVTAVAVGQATITARAAADPSRSASLVVTVTAPVATAELLTTAAPIANLTGAAGARLQYRIAVPQGTSQLVIQTSGGAGDPDLYVRRGQAADTARADCSSGGEATVERCALVNPEPGDWYVLVHGYAGFSGVTLSASTSTAPVVGFNVSAAAASVSLDQGGTASLQVNVARHGGFAEPVSLAVSSGGNGVSVSASPAPIPAAGTSATLTLTASPTASVRSRGLWVFATAGGETKAIVVPLNVLASSTPIIGISVSPSTMSLGAGAAAQLTATVTGAADPAVSWSSSVPTVASVSPTGVVTGLASGTTTITATSVADPTRSAGAVVTVTGGTSSGGTGTVLTSGVTVSGLSGAEDSERLYRVAVPSGATRLEVRTSGGTGDLDLYLRRGAPPTATTIDCASAGDDNNETCTVPNPGAGDWYILLHGFEAYSGVSLVATVSGGGGPAPAAGFTLAASPASISLAPGSTTTMIVSATRSNGFTGAITLTATGLPAGVTATGATIAAGATSATITVSASSSASGASTVTLRGQAAGVADATTTVPLTVAGTGGSGGSGTLGITFDEPTMRIEQNFMRSQTIRIARNGYAGEIELSLDQVPNLESFVFYSLSKTRLAAGESTVNLSVGVGYNYWAAPFALRVRAKPVAGSETVASVSVTVATQFTYSGGFTAMGFRGFSISEAGDRCEFNVGMSGTVTVTVNGLHQGGSMTTRVQGTLQYTALQSKVGRTNCNNGTHSIDVASTAAMIFPFLGGGVTRQFDGWSLTFFPSSKLQQMTPTFNPGNSPMPSSIRFRVNSTERAGLVGEQPIELPLGLQRR